MYWFIRIVICKPVIKSTICRIILQNRWSSTLILYTLQRQIKQNEFVISKVPSDAIRFSQYSVQHCRLGARYEYLYSLWRVASINEINICVPLLCISTAKRHMKRARTVNPFFFCFSRTRTCYALKAKDAVCELYTFIILNLRHPNDVRSTASWYQLNAEFRINIVISWISLLSYHAKYVWTAAISMTMIMHLINKSIAAIAVPLHLHICITRAATQKSNYKMHRYVFWL